MAMEECQAGVIGHKIHMDFLVASDHRDILPYSRRGVCCGVGQLKAVTVKVEGMDVIAGVTHAKAVTLALLQMKCSGFH